MIITYNIVHCVCDEEFDSFCCRFTTMSRVMEHGGCRIASPSWQTKSLGARRQCSQATVNNVLPLMTDSRRFWPGHLISPTRHGCTAHSEMRSWWRHQMEPFSALLALCAGNSPVSGEVPTQRPVTASFDDFFDLRVNKRLSKQSWGWWFETLLGSLWRHRNVFTSLIA